VLLKSKIKRLRKDLTGLYLNNPINSVLEDHKQRKYSLDDWAIDDIRKVIFPKGREYFDPTNEHLIDKWEMTDWGKNEYLTLLTVPELQALESWLERKEG
jgi:hypothetical protein